MRQQIYPRRRSVFLPDGRKPRRRRFRGGSGGARSRGDRNGKSDRAAEIRAGKRAGTDSRARYEKGDEPRRLRLLRLSRKRRENSGRYGNERKNHDHLSAVRDF